ncbi:hypothetical protein C4577_00310 [Candidatus Parcubacteria bacterium]|nr:MAG: hypothetical protein C4577_00310 [Candidatus Parcubacteria bacterium]
MRILVFGKEQIMSSNWIQLFVRAPQGNGYTTPQAMKRIDDHLTQSGLAALKCPPPSAMPVQEPDSTWEVRVFSEGVLFLVEEILTKHYGLEIVRKVEHQQ